MRDKNTTTDNSGGNRSCIEMNPFEDRVCPTYQVLLPEGSRRCAKCGQFVEVEDTSLEFIDSPRKTYGFLVSRVGRFWAVILSGALAILMLLFLIAIHVGVRFLLK